MASQPATQKALEILIACIRWIFRKQLILVFSDKEELLEILMVYPLQLTHLRPMKSAMGPIVIAPIIAPKVSMEPNNEYCIQKGKESSKDEVRIFSKLALIY